MGLRCLKMLFSPPILKENPLHSSSCSHAEWFPTETCQQLLYRYLSVLISSDLMWSTHIVSICNKIRRLIGILYRQLYKNSSTKINTLLKLYTSFIRSHLEYACTAWDPFLKKYITLLEDVQKFVLKICIKVWDHDYDTLLLESCLPSLAHRIQQAKLHSLYYNSIIKLMKKAIFLILHLYLEIINELHDHLKRIYLKDFHAIQTALWLIFTKYYRSLEPVTSGN